MKKGIRQMVSSTTPSAIRRYYRICRAHKRALQEDRRLAGMEFAEAPLVDGCRLFRTRQDLLSIFDVGGIGAEVGVATGDFTSDLLRIAQPACLYLIDPWIDESSVPGKVGGRKGLDRINEALSPQIEKGIVALRRGFSIDELAKIDRGVLDWIYIDAVHDSIASEPIWVRPSAL